MELLNTCARRFHCIIVVSDTAYPGIKIITDYWKTTTCGGIFLEPIAPLIKVIMTVATCQSPDHENDLKNTCMCFIQRKVLKCHSPNRKANKKAFDDDV